MSEIREDARDLEGALLAVVLAVAIGFPIYALLWGLPNPLGPSPGPMMNHAVWAPIMMAVAGLALALFLVMLWGIVEAERGRPPEAPPATSGTSLHDVLARYASGELSRQDFIRIVRDMDPEGARGMP